MSRLDATDIQGFAVRGYNFPFARFLFLKILERKKGRAWLGRLIAEITTGERWDHGKPKSTVNVAFTYKRCVHLQRTRGLRIAHSIADVLSRGVRAGHEGACSDPV
jgi:hypothetical protein